MKRRLLFATKLVALVGLAATSSALTFLVVSAVRRASATPPLPPAPPKPSSGGRSIRIADWVAPGEQPALAKWPAHRRAPQTIAGHAMNWMDVQMQGNVANVKAKAFIEDVRPDVRYVWSVRVLDRTTKEVVFQKVYDDQVFELPEDRQLHPTFQDAIELPLVPGIYDMEVAAYMVTPKDGLAPIRSPKRADRLRGPWGMAKIKVGG